MLNQLRIRHHGLQSYEPIVQLMRDFTDSRDAQTLDEIWCLEHLPVYTQGQAGKPEHVLLPTKYPIIQSDRGGQVTYHGPGQLIIYLLLDIRRLGISVRQFVNLMEQAVVKTLSHWQISAVTKASAPGVYVDGSKIASLGIRVRRGACFHGLALNVDMDLAPFLAINTCGYAGLEVVQLKDLVPSVNACQVEQILLEHLIEALSSRQVDITTEFFQV